MAGVCLIHLKAIRPVWLGPPWGIASENAAHRFAVEWDADGQTRQGVFIPRRDTSSRLNALVGGRLFPGEHHHARFETQETGSCVNVAMRSDDGRSSISVEAREASDFPESSVFSSLEEASAFFEDGSLGYSATKNPGRFDGLELRCGSWSVQPLAVGQLRSSFFDDLDTFPEGTATFDHALLMRGIDHEWHGRTPLCCPPPS